MRIKRFLATAMVVAMVATGCGGNEDVTDGSSASSSTKTENVTSAASQATEVVHAGIADADRVEITADFKITTDDGKVTQDGSTYTITSAGTYTVSGKLANGQIVVEAGESDKVEILLNQASINCNYDSPILAKEADSVKVKVEEGTYNEVIDSRPESTEDSDEAGSAAIFSKADLSLAGKGKLVVSSSYNNGIHSKDDLSIKNVTLKVSAVNNALKGNDGVEIESGDIVLISTGGDGIKTTNSDVSSKGNQRGIVAISGGNIDIYVACDGIDAAYDVDVSGDGNINIYTATYSDYSGSVNSGSGSDFYIIVPMADYSEKYDYYAYYYNTSEDTGKWVKAAYSTNVSSGSNRYYGLLAKAPSGYSSVAFYIVNAGATPSVTDYVSCSKGANINTLMNAFLFNSGSANSVSGDWVNLTTGNNRGQGGNNSKSQYSCKGIKADNNILIAGANINISCKDDAIHANSDATLENGKSGAGTVEISGGNITIIAADDGIHGDDTVTISGGYINVKESYEGIEGNTINISGGDVFVYASDDGLNACSGSKTPSINVSGGYVDVTTPSGDTDAIDSNGTITQTGGYILVKGGNSQGSMAGSVDADGKVTVTGGTIIALGGICELPENSCNAYASQGTSFGAGKYELKDNSGKVIATFELTTTYSSGWLCSDAFEVGKTYTLYKDGSSVISWTQESGTMGATGMGGFGGKPGMGGQGGGMQNPGGQGGFGGRR